MNKSLQLPTGWKVKRLKDVGKCLTGLTYSPNDVTDDSGLLVLRSSNVQGGKLVFNDNVFVKRELNVKNYTQSGDILVCVRNGSSNLIGKNAIVTADGEGLAHGAFMMLFRSKHNQFLYQLFSSELYNKQVYRNLGATINSINSSDFYKFRFPFPPLPEQKAIADLLATWDEAIEKTERLIQVKEMRFKWLLRELISEPRNTQKDAKWEKVKVGSFLNESRIPGTNGRDAQKITVKLYGKGVIPKDEKRIGSETTQYYMRKAGQFIYSKLDFLNGAFGIIPDELDGFESTLDLPTFDISDSVSKEWFLYYLVRPEYYTRQLGLAKGQRKARRVNPSEFLSSRIFLPPIAIQQEIAETLSSAQYEIDLLKHLADKYKTQKRGLMQKMLTGKWRVKSEIVNQYKEVENVNKTQSIY